jgi:uncharacterized protein
LLAKATQFISVGLTPGSEAGAASRASHISIMANATKACPICGKPADEQFRPFCSQRCREVDLNRWLSGVYAVPVTADEEEDERRDEGGEAPT